MSEPTRSNARKRDVWLWLGGVAVLVILAVIFFGPAGGDNTTDVHPGGAPPASEPEAAEPAPDADPYAAPIDPAGDAAGDAPIAGVPDGAE